jgi:hypothetical protein
MGLEPADQQPAEDQRPAGLALVFEAVDLVLQGTRVVGDRINALDAPGPLQAQRVPAGAVVVEPLTLIMKICCRARPPTEVKSPSTRIRDPGASR